MVVVLLLLRLEYRSGTFIFFSYFSLVWLCASVLPLWYCVVAEAGCIWYLFDINKFPLSKKENYLPHETMSHAESSGINLVF